MNNIKKITALILFLVIQFLGNAQENVKLKRANKHFENYAYVEAINLYEELANQKVEYKFISNKLANCYRLINNTEKAAYWYSEFIKFGEYTYNDAYYYSMALRSNKKIKEADEWMEIFRKLNTTDSRGVTFSSKEEKMKEIQNKKNNFRITNLHFNSKRIEFAPYTTTNGEMYIVAEDENQLYVKREFEWNKTAFLDIYKLNKINDTTFENKTKLKGKVNTKFHDGPITMIPSNLEMMYFTRNNYLHKKTVSKEGVLKLRIYSSSKNKRGKWKKIEQLHLGPNEYSYGHPALSKDCSKLFFTSDMPGSIGGTDIWMVIKSKNKWGKPINLGPDVNTEGNEMFPYVSSNGDLFFSSNGHFGLGGLDVFYAPLNNNSYRHIYNLGEGINSPKDDFSFIVNEEFTKCYFSSNRDGGKGDDDIYFAQILSTFKLKYLDLTIRNIETGEVVKNSSITLQQNGKTYSYTTNNEGKIEVIIEPNSEINVSATGENLTSEKAILNSDITYEQIKHTLYLAPKDVFYLHANIKEKQTGKDIENVNIIIREGKKTMPFITDANGEIYFKLPTHKIGDSLSLKLRIEKEGYLGKEIKYSKKINQSGVYSINELLDIDLYKIEKGLELGKALKINPIYFDFNKDNIRPDAAVELDKIVSILKKHPEIYIELGSHTDCRGSEEFNEDLSYRRAESSREYIINKGIEEKRIYGKGYGESKLVNHCKCDLKDENKYPEALHQKNRRTEFVIVKILN
jgi:outer membrane protein OmpA-like peptidoglycan-associated protein